MFSARNAKAAVTFVQRNVDTLSIEVLASIASQLGHPQTEVSADTLRIWTALLLSVPNTPEYALTRLLRKAGQAGDIETTAMLFEALVRPQLELEARNSPARGVDGEDERFSLDGEIALRGEHYDLDKTWRDVLLPNLGSIYLHVLPLITTCLTRAHSFLVASGQADARYDPMSQRRRAIERHQQDRHSPEWGLLVDVARDALDWLLANDADMAAATIETWRRASPRLLNRLSVYGQARRKDLSPERRLELIQEHRWLYDRPLKHEVFDLLSLAFPSSGDEAQRAFISYSMRVPEPRAAEDPEAERSRAYARYNVAVWLRRIAPDSVPAREHFEALQQQHPDFGERAHPDLDVWISA